MPRRSPNAGAPVLIPVLVTVALVLVSALGAGAAHAITLTWVRHAQSTANAAGIIDTSVPGPGLTALGDIQAQQIAETLIVNGHDGIYVSDMIRTQLTAAPLATKLGMAPVVLGGLREINAGIFEARGGPFAGIGYALPPAAWVLGARFVPILGGENGNGFAARVNDTVGTISASGAAKPVLFAHGATIMAWTLMTVENPNLLLALTHPLGNTASVVVDGNPDDGWTLQSWDGVPVDPNPGLLTKFFVAVRKAVVAPQTALSGIGHPPTQSGRSTRSAAAVRAGVDSTATDSAAATTSASARLIPRTLREDMQQSEVPRSAERKSTPAPVGRGHAHEPHSVPAAG
jgi:broad specificity phosphatase PhoE